jgi:hypothetical protein
MIDVLLSFALSRYHPAMPPLYLHVTLEQAGDARLVVECGCGRTSLLFCRAMARDLGGHYVVADLARRLRCRAPSCRSAPAIVTMVQAPTAQLDGLVSLRRYLDAKPAPLTLSMQAMTGQHVAAWLAQRPGDERPRLGLQGGMWNLEFKAEEAARLAYWLSAWWLRG